MTEIQAIREKLQKIESGKITATKQDIRRLQNRFYLLAQCGPSSLSSK